MPTPKVPPDKGNGKGATLVPAPTAPAAPAPAASATQSNPTSTATSAWEGGSNVGPFSPDKLRSYAQIQADAKAAASFSSPSSISLQFKLAKIQLVGHYGVLTNPKILTHDQFGDFLFDELKINHGDCLELDLSGQWDTMEVFLKTSTKVDHLLTNSPPRKYLNHEITIPNSVKNVTKVYFGKVPPSVPDEEILHLCMAYSVPIDGQVHRETMRLGTTNRVNVTDTTRFVEMKLHPGKYFKTSTG